MQFYFAFEVPDRSSLALAYQTLRDAEISVALVGHLISWALYFSDPDGRALWRGENIPLAEETLQAAFPEGGKN